MTQAEQQENAKAFAENWRDKGDEKQETQRYWIGILGEVLGIINPQNYIEFEKRVKRISHTDSELLRNSSEKNENNSKKETPSGVSNPCDNSTRTNFIDAYIPETKVLIEQKGLKIDLNKAYEQSDGTVLTPYEQAKRYADEMPYDLRPRWIVVSNFAEIHVHDMNKPNEPPEIIFLKDLEKDFYRLEFLVDRKNENIRREEEISLAAGKLVGKMYDALIKEYINPTAESYRSLNILCVRLVFCFYAEDAMLFETRTSFEDYIKSFNLQNVRVGLIKLFKALDTKIEERDKYDDSLKPFPYVNGGLFHDENIEIPNFTQEIVDVLINDCAPFDWHEISPTIFGAVFESTLNPETRRKGGMHYTSIENIHKVIDPLFLDELNAEFDEIMGTSSLQANTHSSLRGNKMSLSGLTRQSKNKKIAVSSTAMTGKQRTTALYAFQEKLGHLTFLDPACGSGNFLTETYLSLRRLENKVISVLNKGEKVLGFDEFIKVKINQFYGIEINDFAVTVAKTALWIAESQMINETEKILEQQIDFLPLKEHANIVEGNALRMDWTTLSEVSEHAGFLFTEKLNVYKIDKDFGNIDIRETAPEYGKHYKELNVVAKEVENKEFPKKEEPKPHEYNYIIGNPPFVGARYMNKNQKDDVLLTFGKNWQGVGDLDYVCCWYKKAFDTIKNTSTSCAFVSTNSLTQGGTVANLWKPLFESGLEIDFAWRTFKWENETTDKEHMAAVHCVIIGFSCVRPTMTNCNKFIFDENGKKIVAKNINGYLMDAPNVFIENRKKPLCNVKEMVFGSMANDGRNLLIEKDEYADFVKHDPKSEKYIRQFLGSEEFINNKKRYCLWLVGASPSEIRKMPLVYERVGAVKKLRESSSREATRKLANTSWLFGEIRQPESGNYLLIPRVSSENRRYVPIGFISSDVIASDATLIIPNAELYDFGILTSSVHMAWMRAVAGRLKSDYRYSAQIVYNNFVWPESIIERKNAVIEPVETIINRNKGDFDKLNHLKTKIEQTAQAILDARAKYPDSSLADLYDETLMPADLRKAHEANDRAVMQAYGFDAKMSESEIVAELFKMYEKICAEAV